MFDDIQQMLQLYTILSQLIPILWIIVQEYRRYKKIHYIHPTHLKPWWENNNDDNFTAEMRANLLAEDL